MFNNGFLTGYSPNSDRLRRLVNEFSRNVGLSAVLGGLAIWIAFLVALTLLMEIFRIPMGGAGVGTSAGNVGPAVPVATLSACVLIAAGISIRMQWRGELGSQIRELSNQRISSGLLSPAGLISGIGGVALGVGSAAFTLVYVIAVITAWMIIPIVLAFGSMALILF